ncbi:hypothetical protein [Mesorhizobium sp.]|uniref:hypothetical protein n=1 Tax=Mesorhizobium sp. TaxID=1871066 RepID=UPI0025BCB438|nr:hypothetical protein [Mesorhizobium sp.]
MGIQSKLLVFTTPNNLAKERQGHMAGKRAIAVKDWSCAMSDEIGRVVLAINSTEGETTYVLMTVFQAAKMAQELRSPKMVPRYDM